LLTNRREELKLSGYFFLLRPLLATSPANFPFFDYTKKRDLYLSCTAMAEHAIRKFAILPLEDWLTFIDNFFLLS
jgi:hypothetical protein